MNRPKPLRSYRAFAAGDRFEMQFNVDRETLQKLMAMGAIDEAGVLSLAKKYRIPAKAVRELTWAANAMRVTEPADNVLYEDAEATRFVEECEALADKIADLQGDLDKLVGTGPGEGFIRFRGDGGPGVIEIDTGLLARFRAEADRTMQYLRDWSARAQPPPGFRAVTVHGDIMVLAQIIERVAHRASAKPGFGNATGRGVMFIEEILIRAAVIKASASNGDMICKAIQRYRGKAKKLKNNQPD